MADEVAVNRPAHRISELAAALLSAAALASCGGESSTDQVSIVADNRPEGDPALTDDKAAGPANARVPVTAKGTPTIIYKAPVRSLSKGMRLRAVATVTLTKCAVTDYIPNQRAHTACQGTKEYDYDPVEVETGFRLVGGDSGPDLSKSVKRLGPAKTTTCTTKVHHCTISQDYEMIVSGSDLSRAGWVVFEATAASPQAKGCVPPKASACNVLAVEDQKGTAMYWVQADAGVSQTGDLPADTSEDQRTLPVVTGHGDKDDARKVVYSADLSSGGSLSDLEGAQFEVDSLLKIDESLPQAPDISGYLVLSDSPTGITGRYLVSNSYDPNRTGNAGGNCDTTCAASRPAVITSILGCDVSAGRRYVNLVADASRAAAKKGESVRVADGGYVKVTRKYPADVSADEANGSCDS